ncbi:MAG: hypothetical protein ACJ788_04185 [Ktedonobacteraceae bacterium]
MRQGNGSDLLGANDPRSATIGVIYVAPNDDRESVLAAILTQEKLGREQIAIVLPNQNKAFHVPVDFDGLKNMRNKLQAKLVIIAPYGSGPAEFARHRRFTYFTSLESYGKSLRDEKEASRPGRSGRWPFRGRRSKLYPLDDATNTNEELEPASSSDPEAPSALPPAADTAAAADKQAPQPHVSYAAMGMEDAMLTSGNVPAHEPDDENTALPPLSQRNNAVDDVALASTAAPLVVANTPANSGSAQDTISPPPPVQKLEDANPAPDGDIITFPTRKRNTVKLAASPPPDVSEADDDYNAAVADPPVALSRRNSGKTPVVVPAAGGIAPVSTGRKANTGNLAAFGGNPPGGGNTAGGGRRRRGGWIFLALIILLLASLFLCVTLAFAAPGALPSPVRNFVTGMVGGGAPAATVTITPKSADELNTYVLTGVTSGTPDSAKRQVQARQLTYTTPSQKKTMPATGIVDPQPVHATGTLTFYNGNGTSYSVGKTIFTDAKGVQIANNSLVIIPAGSPATGYGHITVPATAITGGTRGNIRALDFNYMQCCGSSSVFVSNGAFGGGQDPQHYTAVQQSDIDGAAHPLQQPLTQSALSTLNGMKHTNEQFVAKPTCTTKVVTDHNAGDRATSVTVTVTATCAGRVYDQIGAQTIAAGLLNKKALQDLGSSYAPVGKVVTSVTKTTIDGQGNLSLFVKAEGIWVYQFTNAQKTQLAKDIAGKNKNDASTLLEQQPGVGHVEKIDITGTENTTLPMDYTQISIVVQNVPGIQGTVMPTTSPGSSVTPTTTTGATPIPTSPTPVPSPSVGGS